MSGGCRLFVYGTLVPGGRWWHVVEPFVTAGVPATAVGRLFDTGAGYPGATFADAAAPGADHPDGIVGGPPGTVHGTVHGAVLDLLRSTIEQALAEIDEFEGTEYERIVIETSEGAAWAYHWRGPTGHLTEVRTGRWTDSE